MGLLGALAIAVGTAFSLVAALARRTRDISMRLDVAQRAAEAIEDRISERLASYAWGGATGSLAPVWSSHRDVRRRI
jgi:hypothetical protein